MTCIIIEDQAPAQRILKKFISDFGNLQLIEAFSDPIKALTFLNSQQVDLIFLDVHLPKISGIDFLKSLVNKPYIILTTAYTEYALEGYELNIVDYLLKPFSFDRFIKAVLKVPKNNSTTKVEKYPEEIFLKTGYEYIKISIPEVIAIKADMDYTELLSTHNKYISSESLKHWQDQLSPRQFIRIHKSYIVNMKKVTKVLGNQVYLLNKEILPVGRAYKENLMRYLQ